MVDADATTPTTFMVGTAVALLAGAFITYMMRSKKHPDEVKAMRAPEEPVAATTKVSAIEQRTTYAENYEATPPVPAVPAPDAAKNPFVTLLGASLQSKAGTLPTAAGLAGKKAVGLYFSAHWCPPCKQFTPLLGKCYTNALKAKGCEIVFVSSDNDEDEFTSYYMEQADWLALPYAARDIHKALNKKYKIQGIPSLVILDGSTGEVITTDARMDVMDDVKAERFPWKPKTFFEALGTEFMTGDEGDTLSLEEVQAESKYIGLYFSASWCGPCVAFTPQLAAAYTDHLHAGKGLEIIFCSADNDTASFLSYFQKQPWLAIPNGDPRNADLQKLFGVEGYPTLVVVDAHTGELITTKARMNVMSDPKGDGFPWVPKAAVDADAEGPDGINETPSLCVLLDGCDAEARASAIAAITQVAEAHRQSVKANGEEPICFFYSTAPNGPFCKQLRQLSKLEVNAGQADVVLFDIPDDGGYYIPADGAGGGAAVTKERLEKILADYAAQTLIRRQLGA